MAGEEVQHAQSVGSVRTIGFDGKRPLVVARRLAQRFDARRRPPLAALEADLRQPHMDVRIVRRRGQRPFRVDERLANVLAGPRAAKQAPHMPRSALQDRVVQRRGLRRLVLRQSVRKRQPLVDAVEAAALDHGRFVVVHHEAEHARRQHVLGVEVAAHPRPQVLPLDPQMPPHGLRRCRAPVDGCKHGPHVFGVAAAVGPLGVVQEAHQAPGQRVDARQIVALPIHSQALVQHVLHRCVRLAEQEPQQRVRPAPKCDLPNGVDMQVGQIRCEALFVPDGQIQHRPAAQQEVRVFVVRESVQMPPAAIRAERQQALRQRRLRETDDMRRQLEERRKVLGALEHQQPRRRRRIQRASRQQRVGGAAKPIQGEQQGSGLRLRKIGHQLEMFRVEAAPAPIFDAGMGRKSEAGRQHGGPPGASHAERCRRARWRCARSPRRPKPADRKHCARRRSSAASRLPSQRRNQGCGTRATR